MMNIKFLTKLLIYYGDSKILWVINLKLDFIYIYIYIYIYI